MSHAEKKIVTNGGTPLRMELGAMQGFELHAKYHAPRTGGDFFDGIQMGTRVAFLLTDIAGRKEHAHPIAVAAQVSFRSKAAEFYSAADANLMDATAMLIHEINHAIVGASTGSHFAPTFVGCYDRELGVLAYINAGGLTAVIQDSDGVRALPDVAMPMGLFTHLTYEPSMHAFEPGARLLVVTKGITERQRGRSVFGKRVMGLVESLDGASAAEVCEATLKAAHEFKKVSSWLGRLAKGPQVAEDLTALVAARPKAGR
jgi:serine phosphatase RsbU (regulator of sigma subunit)